MWLDEEALQELVHGGAVLGAGGGGSLTAGLAAGRSSLSRGRPRLTELSALPARAVIATVSGVGAVSGAQAVGRLDWQHRRALQLFRGMGNPRIGGLIPSEVGPLAVTYGWQESAETGLPIVDAPCNGRAHPLSLMGLLGLHRMPHCLTDTVAVGGKRDGARFELVLRSNATDAARIVRQSVSRLRIPLGVVRAPLPVSHVGKHAAVGGLADARRVGATLLRNLGAGVEAVLKALSAGMGGAVLARGVVRSANLEERAGFTLGEIRLRPDVSIPVCNEYMMVMRNGSAIAAFPDLITIFDRETGLPLNSADVAEGRNVAVFAVPRARLRLASTMRDPGLLTPIQKLLNLRFPVLPTDEVAPRQKLNRRANWNCRLVPEPTVLDTV